MILGSRDIQFRDIIIADGSYPWTVKPGVIPGSDGAGTVMTIGKHVNRFKPGDKVVTIINQQFISGSMTKQTLASGLGAEVDGTFRTLGAFDEHGLVVKGLTLLLTLLDLRR